MHNSEGVVGAYIVDESEGVIETAIVISLYPHKAEFLSIDWPAGGVNDRDISCITDITVKGWSARVIRIYSPGIFPMISIERVIKALQYSILIIVYL